MLMACVLPVYRGLNGPDGPVSVRAARLWAASEGVREAAAIELPPLGRAATNYEGRLAATRTELGEEAFEKAWSEGRKMATEEAVRYALSDEEAASLSNPEEWSTPSGAHNLTRRELEIAKLVARGLTNRRIASELFISERTVGTHLGRVFKKLEIHSREQVAEFFAEPSQDWDSA